MCLETLSQMSSVLRLRFPQSMDLAIMALFPNDHLLVVYKWNLLN